ncbi:MAG: macro domain-containing protein [Micropepsaceae bacterium]
MKDILSRFEIVVGDITRLDVDVIVNAANSRLVPGGGVDGAINKAAGARLGRAMMAIGRCAEGEAVITPGFGLRASHVIHTVAPVYAQHKPEEVWRLLRLCYANALAIARGLQVRSIAFPGLGTGAYAIPVEDASKVAVMTVIGHCATENFPERIVFCCFSEGDADQYRKVIEGLGS